MKRPAHLAISPSDKRVRELYATRLQTTVQKCRDIQIASFGGIVLVNSKRTILKTELFAPPGTALERCLNDPAIRQPLVRALEDTMAELLDPDSPCNIKTEVDQDTEPGSGQIIRKPPRPVFSLSCNDMITYFPQFLRDLYKLEGWAMGTYRLHPKLNAAGEVIAAPDKLDIYDEIAEGILPRLKYCGSGKKFGKDLLLKQKSVCSYIFSKLGLDHKTFAVDVREVEIVTNSELVAADVINVFTAENDHVYNVGHDTPEDPLPFMDTMDNNADEEMNSLEVPNGVDTIKHSSNYPTNEEEMSRKASTNMIKSKRKKKMKYESSESSDSSSDEEIKPNKNQRYSRKKKSSKHSAKESQIFQKTFMKMMQKTMKSVLAQQLK